MGRSRNGLVSKQAIFSFFLFLPSPRLLSQIGFFFFPLPLASHRIASLIKSVSGRLNATLKWSEEKCFGEPFFFFFFLGMDGWMDGCT